MNRSRPSRRAPDRDPPRPPRTKKPAGAGAGPRPRRGRYRGAAPENPPAGRGAAPTAWNQVARWYDALIADEGSDYHRAVLLPGITRLLEPLRGARVLDLGCGQGVLARHLAAQGAAVLGLDAAPALIECARARAGASGAGRATFAVGDAAALTTRAPGGFDAVACLLAIQNMDPLEPIVAGIAHVLVAGGRCVLVLTHPCFRIPRQSHWGWDEDAKLQYRRVDRYLTPLNIPIQMRPGAAPEWYTMSFHRPLSAYVNLLGACGLFVDRLEEWVSHHRSTGAHAKAENRARAELPLFLALRAVKTGRSYTAMK